MLLHIHMAARAGIERLGISMCHLILDQFSIPKAMQLQLHALGRGGTNTELIIKISWAICDAPFELHPQMQARKITFLI
jgi:hypothetical protein